MDSGLPILILTAIIILFALSALKIAGEGERFATFTLGRYEGLKGPGLVIILWGVQRLIRLRVGDVGVMVGEGIARFQEQDLPVQVNGSMALGDAVTISGFAGSEVRVQAGGALVQTFRCAKCGHENEISIS